MSTDFRDRAACAEPGVDPELFFPPGKSELAQAQAERAKRICAACPVAAACLAEAVEQGDDTSVRGGLTATERRIAKTGVPV